MWRCPVSEEDVERREGEVFPARHITYRCLYCRIDLVFDEDYAAFKLAPFPASRRRKPTKPRQRRTRQ
jgi:hypothetical protein